MKYNIVTVFDETLLQQSTITLLNEFRDNWEKEIDFHCYYYNIDLANYSLPQAPNIHYHNLLEVEDYKKFLKGEKWEQQLANIDYANVTMDISKFVVDTLYS